MNLLSHIIRLLTVNSENDRLTGRERIFIEAELAKVNFSI